MRMWQIPCKRCGGHATNGDRRCTLCDGSGVYIVTPAQYVAWRESELDAGRPVWTNQMAGLVRYPVNR